MGGVVVQTGQQELEALAALLGSRPPQLVWPLQFRFLDFKHDWWCPLGESLDDP